MVVAPPRITIGSQTTLDQFTTEPNLARGYGSEERLSNLRTGIANHNAYMDSAVQQYSDLEPNTGPGQERILGASGHTRIPDFRDLGELKTGRVIQNTGNLKDFITYAEQTGGQVRLFVRPGVDLAPIQIAIDRNLVAVYYVKPILVLPAQ